tara:strand:+ start:2159 stop:3025 length:867 start_codon:yes stop_codon:yes gene_type:complete
MGFPVDIKLPDQARYYTFIETSKRFNSNYDITWSFEYKLPETSIPNNNNYELGFSTFITNLSAPLSSLPGQYIGDQDPGVSLSAVALLTEGAAPELLRTQSDDTLVYDGGTLSGSIVKIAFDSTGRYALSARDDRPGVTEAEINRQSLVVRDYQLNVRANSPLSTISNVFSTLSTNTFRTLRFRYVNLGQKVHIDFRESDTTEFTLLTTINIEPRLTGLDNLENFYCGFSLSTPISTTDTGLSARDFFLRNFNVEGYVGTEVLTETVMTPPLSVNSNIQYTTVTNITA